MKNCINIIYLTGTRSEYGLMRETLKKLNKNFKLGLIITGTHLSKKYGYTIREIEKDHFDIIDRIILSHNNDLKSMANNIGKLIPRITDILDRVKPDLVLVEGDRGEQLAMAIAASTMNIPVVHTSGGIISKSIDDSFRNAITKLAHIHLAPTKESAKRIIKMNEESWRVHVVGTPINLKFKKIDIHARFNLKRNEPLLIVLQHPVSSQVQKSGKQMKETMEAIMTLKYQSIIIYPNSDAGSEEMIREIQKYKNVSFLRIFKNLESDIFMNLLANASVIVGNSSAGIVEGPFFRLAAINIGIRQKNREHGNNIINVDHKRFEIINGVNKALTKEFRSRIKRNPYGIYGKFEDNIVNVLSRLEINSRLTSKEHPY